MFRSLVASLMSDIRVGFGGPMVLLCMALSVDSLLMMVGWSRCLLSSNQSSGGHSSVVAVVCAASAIVVLKKVV